MELVSRSVRHLHHLLHPVVRTLVDVMIKMIETDEATKVIEVRTATEEEVVPVFMSTSKTEVHRVELTSSPTFPATVVGQMQTAPTTNA
jgi:hypothetical protein